MLKKYLNDIFGVQASDEDIDNIRIICEELKRRDKEIERRVVTPLDLKQAICEVWGITTGEIDSQLQKRELVDARYCFFWFVSQEDCPIRMSESLAATWFNKGSGRGYDHSTVNHAKKQFQKLLDTDRNVAAKLEKVREKLKQHKNVYNDVFKVILTNHLLGFHRSVALMNDCEPSELLRNKYRAEGILNAISEIANI